jgi:hypothetical protein
LCGRCGGYVTTVTDMTSFSKYLLNTKTCYVCNCRLSLSVILRPMVSRPVCLGIKHPSGAYGQIFSTVDSYGLVLCGAPSLTRRRVCLFLYTAGPCQRSLSLVRVPKNSRPYFTVSDLRLPFSSPPTARRVTVEVFDPASTRE